jgi:CRP-like cAMP-binding protein
LFHSMETVYLASGEYIFQPDDFVQHIYFPETAVVSEFQILEDGKTNEVIMTGNEGAIGINSIFYAHPSPNWTQVLISGKALRMDAEICRREMNSLPNFRAGFYEYLNKYIAQITQRVICNNHHSVEERLCCWLLMIHDRCGSDTLSLTQEQIAHFLGVHRPSITLITQSLREKAIIDYVRGKIFILDRYKLEYASCSCYSPAKFI